MLTANSPKLRLQDMLRRGEGGRVVSDQPVSEVISRPASREDGRDKPVALGADPLPSSATLPKLSLTSKLDSSLCFGDLAFASILEEPC